MEIKIDNVNYGNLILKNINLSFKSDKIYGIFGLSGSGKTTLLELINGLILPTEGIITIGDYKLEKGKKNEDINKLRFNVGLVFQFPEEQFFNTTVKDEIAFAMKCFNYKKDKIDERILEVLKLVGLNETYLNRNPFKLSDGEKRKVAIASILVFNPKIILLDEPTIGLDDNGKEKLINIIKKLKNKYNKMIIICSKDIDILYKIVDDLVILDKGEVILNGTKDEVLDNTEILEKYKIGLPMILEFREKVMKEKNIKLDKHLDIRDLIKDIYRNV